VPHDRSSPAARSLLAQLAGGDRRSIGRSGEVVAEVLHAPSLFKEVFDGLLRSVDPLVRMRAADAVEKITAVHPEYLRPFKRALLEQVAQSAQPEVRWHVAQMIPRLHLSQAERMAAVAILFRYLRDSSRLVRTFSMQALAELAEQDARLRPKVVKLIRSLVKTGSPAVKSRGRKLLTRLA